MSALLLGGILWLAAPLQATPDARQVDAARHALVQCRLDEPAALLDASWLARMRALQRLALHAEDVQDMVSLSELAQIAALRREQRFELGDVYAAECRADTPAAIRKAIAGMRLADPVVVRDAAWVPLVTPGGDYLGTGLSFARVDGAWRWSSWDHRVLARSAQTQVLSLELGGTVSWPGDEPDFQRCVDRLPPAPMPWPAEEVLAAEEADDASYAPDESNALGAAQRLAALRFGEGRGERPSAPAKLILAEVLLRSLDFQGAPAFPGERWRQRVRRAEALIAEARLHSVDWQRMAPILVWLARAHESGQGGLSIDPTLAMGYRQLAASSGTAEVKDLVAELEAQSWLPVPPGDDLRFEMPVEEKRCE
jgi:hypothetical protein